MIDERNFFDQPVKDDLKTCDNIKKIATGHKVMITQLQSWPKITRQVWKKLKHISEMKSKNPHPPNPMLVVLENELPFQH